jgi:Fe-S-cluster containining protein
MPSQPHGTDGAVYFNCTMCGDCCSSWNISIEAEKAVTLLEKEWVTSRLQQVNRSISKLSNEVYRIPLTAENVCIFLNPNKTCMIQEKEGLLLKPSECQRFPFASVVLPTGQLQHDTSAACKKIAEELLLTFQSILPNSDKTENMAHATIQQHKPTKETDYLLREDAEAFTGEFFLSLSGDSSGGAEPVSFIPPDNATDNRTSSQTVYKQSHFVNRITDNPCNTEQQPAQSHHQFMENPIATADGFKKALPNHELDSADFSATLYRFQNFWIFHSDERTQPGKMAC